MAALDALHDPLVTANVAWKPRVRARVDVPRAHGVSRGKLCSRGAGRSNERARQNAPDVGCCELAASRRLARTRGVTGDELIGADQATFEE